MPDTSAAMPAPPRPRAAPARRRPAERYSRPIYDEEIVIQSDHAQRLVRRGLLAVVRALYAIDVVLRILGEDESMDEVEALVDRLIAAFADDVTGEIARLNKLVADHGVSLRNLRYDNPRRMVVHISSPQLASYVDQIKQLDAMGQLVDRLWLGKVLTNQQRSRSGYAWRVKMQKIASEIVAIEKRARAAVARRGLDAQMQAEDERLGGAQQSLGFDDEEEPETAPSAPA